MTTAQAPKWEVEAEQVRADIKSMLDAAGYRMECVSYGRDPSSKTPGRLVATVAVRHSTTGKEILRAPYSYPSKALLKYGQNKSKSHLIKGSTNAPDTRDVLASLLLDASCVDGNSHSDFCSQLDYDQDSRKGMEIYLACQKHLDAMRKIFGAKLGEAMSLAASL